MKPIRIGVMLAGMALVGLSAVAAAQAPPPVLNTLELQKAVASGEPADHGRLRAHFAALADREAAEAKRHQAMSQAYVGSRSPGLGAGMQVHCRRLAELATESASTLRELAAYHEKLAAGLPAIAPRGAGSFEAAARARTPTDEELRGLASKASTPAEHRSLEEYYRTLARRHTSGADEHVTLAQSYRGTRLATAAVHHDRLAALSRDAAKEAEAAATVHGGLAGIAR